MVVPSTSAPCLSYRDTTRHAGRADSSRNADGSREAGIGWKGSEQTRLAPSPSTLQEDASRHRRIPGFGPGAHGVGAGLGQIARGAGCPARRRREEAAALDVAAGGGARPKSSGSRTDRSRPTRPRRCAPLRQARQCQGTPEAPDSGPHVRDPRESGQHPAQPGQEVRHTVDSCLAHEVECRFQRQPNTFAPVLARTGEPRATRPKVMS